MDGVDDEKHKIARLNDEFRGKGHGFTITQGVQALEDVPGLIGAVRRFNEFNEDNDPHGEHDFGVIMWHDNKIFWKIDYYDQELCYWENPLSPQCRRVLTVMLADEY